MKTVRESKIGENDSLMLSFDPNAHYSGYLPGPIYTLFYAEYSSFHSAEEGQPCYNSVNSEDFPNKTLALQAFEKRLADDPVRPSGMGKPLSEIMQKA